MKRFHTTIFAIALTPILGCNEGTSGGPGASSDAQAQKSVLGRADNSFNLSGPVLPTSVQQGGQADVIIGINRTKNFDSDVALEFNSLPKGVTIHPEHPVIKHGDSEAKFAISVDESVVKGEFKISVLGHPNKGADAKLDLRIAVTAKDSFTLNMPLLSTSLKQGKSELVSIKVHRDATFTQDVTLTLVDLPTGVTTEPASIIHRNGQSNAEFQLIAAPDASLGRFAVKLIGHPTSGADTSSEFNFVVLKDE